MSAVLRSFYFHDPRTVVIPVEHLEQEGMTDTFASWLREERDLDDGWVDRFNAAFALYRVRAQALHEASPENWFPKRKQNVCVVLQAAATRPFYLPFNKASWLLYACDFDDKTSHVELACYLFLHTERLCLTQNPAAAVAHNLGYWLQRSEDEIEAFRRAATTCERPDASAFRALGAAMGWMHQVHHPRLRPQRTTPSEPVGQMPQTGLILPASRQPELVALVGAFRSSVGAVAERYFAQFRGPSAADQLAGWFAEAAPRVLITTEGGNIAWDPAEPSQRDGLIRALGDVGAEVATSIRADIEVADARSRRFMRSVVEPDALPLPGHDIEQTGLTYIHARRKLIAYNLQEPDMFRTSEPSSPYERLMLGARTMHEWAHLAVDASLVRVPSGRLSEYARAELQFADILQEIVDGAPAELAEVAAEERALTGAPRLGVGLKDVVLGRMPDYMANVFARELLSLEEMETYVRQQVTTLVQENLGPFGQLARHAYEVQYLTLSAVADPMGYFFDSTWFGNTFVESGIVTSAGFERLVTAMRALCDCFEIDEAAVNISD